MVSSSIGQEQYRVTHSNGRHQFFADEPAEKGGKDTAPTPDELLEAALASCTLVTLRMYTDHKQWETGVINISVSLQREAGKSIITRVLKFEKQIVFVSVDATPDQFKPLSKRMFEANAFILVTPEFNGSYTSAMKNVLDHYPKQSRKAFGIVTASPGMMGGMRATQQMQLLINALFGIASPHMLVVGGVDKKFDAEGNLVAN